MPDTSADRAAAVESRLMEVRERIANACAKAGRAPDEVSLIAVTKTYPASDVRILSRFGVTDVGENRDQEAAPKADECRDLPLTWHFVGQLQTNKARSVVRYADVVHSVDRVRLARSLGARARAEERAVRCLVQVDLDPGAIEGAVGPRGGADPRDVEEIAAAIDAEDGLSVGGVMAVAPLGGDPGAAFARLNSIAVSLRARYHQASMVSAGMSGDLESAVENGATHLRIGTALLGDRGPIVG